LYFICEFLSGAEKNEQHKWCARVPFLVESELTARAHDTQRKPAKAPAPQPQALPTKQRVRPSIRDLHIIFSHNKKRADAPSARRHGKRHDVCILKKTSVAEFWKLNFFSKVK
jgi:hypothetical protein